MDVQALRLGGVVTGGLSRHPAHIDIGPGEGALNIRNRCIDFRRTAHEDIKRGEVRLRPSVDLDIPIINKKNTGNAHCFTKVMEVRLQDRCPRHFGRAVQDRLQMRRIVKPLCPAHIDKRMRADLGKRVVSHRQKPAIRL